MLEKYITGIARNKGHKVLAIFCMPDHCHLLVGLNPNQSVSDLARDLKSKSSKWMNEMKLSSRKFYWQEGFGAFSYSRSQLDVVVKYIRNQPQHHKKKNFREEYLEFLRKFEIKSNDDYLFEWID